MKDSGWRCRSLLKQDVCELLLRLIEAMPGYVRGICSARVPAVGGVEAEELPVGVVQAEVAGLLSEGGKRSPRDEV